MKRFPSFKQMVIMVCILAVLVAPSYAFTAQSLDITIDKNGDALMDFRFTLDGALENALPQSVLEDELKKGLTTDADPPVILSFDKSGVSMLMKKFAVINAVPTGMEYQTTPMDFKKAEIALKNSAVSAVISADFSPKSIVVTFPDGYSRTLVDSSVLPSLIHIVADPNKPVPASTISPDGSLSLSSTPGNALVYIDSIYAGNTPSVFSGIVPGEHQIKLELDGFIPVTKNITVQAGNITTDNVVLTPVTPTPAQQLPGFESSLAGIALVMSGIMVLHRRLGW